MFDIKKLNSPEDKPNMAPKKQKYKCYKCNRDTFRDNTDLKRHMGTCKGILGEAQNAATRSAEIMDHVAVNFAPMERDHLQSQSITTVFVDLQNQALSSVQSAIRLNVADFDEMFVAMFKYCWLNNDHPEHHHLLYDLQDSSGTYCLVFRKGAWQLTAEFSEIRECLNIVAVRFFDVEREIKASMTQINFDKFETYREQVEKLTTSKTPYEERMKEGIRMSEVNVNKTLMGLVNKIRVELKTFTTARGQHYMAARSEAERNRDRIHSDWLVDGALYKEALHNYNKYKDWLPGKPLQVEHLKVVAMFKRCLRVSKDNIKQSVETLLAIDKDLYDAWIVQYGDE